jgi:hypothetical protein
MFFTINKKIAGAEITPEQTETQPQQLLNTLPENSEISTPVEESTQLLNAFEYKIPENYNDKITESTKETLTIDMSSFSEDEKETLRNLHGLILSKTPKVIDGLKLFVSLNKMSGGATKKKTKSFRRRTNKNRKI